MNGLFDIWHNLTPGQGTLLGGAFVLFAGIIAFGTGAHERRSRHMRFHYQELKTLYAEALKIGRDFEVIKALPPDDRGPILTEIVDAMQQVISELALTGNFQTADLAIAYTYQQSVQLAGWTKEVESDVGWPDRFRSGSQFDRRRASRIEDVQGREHQSSRRGTGCTPGVGVVCAGVVTASTRHAKDDRSQTICPELSPGIRSDRCW